MKKIITLIFSICLSVSLFGQGINVVAPTARRGNSFAIVIDNTTLQNVRKQVLAYRDALQEDGLATYIVSGDWQNPEQVRSQIAKLYKREKNLEGIVLVGDIPIVMVRNAQHLTTAFKMNEETFPWYESSVASDRYYDDLNLEFEFLRRDTLDSNIFYYKLKEDSPQRLNPTFYSGRIKYPEAMGGDKYEAVAAFLEKAVEAKKNPQDLDNLVTFMGSGYNSNCLIAWEDEDILVEENFPLIKNDSRHLKQLNFRQDDYIKYRLFDQLQRTDVDAMFFNEHGAVDKQYISNEVVKKSSHDYLNQLKYSSPGIYKKIKREGASGAKLPELIEKYKAEYHLTDKFFEEFLSNSNKSEGELKAEESQEQKREEKSKEETFISLDELGNIKIMPRFVVLNACYNGSFHKEVYVGGYYLFNDGKTVVCQGNTVNVLQDRETYRYIGLLSSGCRVGEYNRLVATLEGHILGDPTFHFNAIPGENLRDKIAKEGKNIKFWKEGSINPQPPVQCVSLRMLADKGALTSEELLRTMRVSPYGTVRMESLELLSERGGEDFIDAIRLGLTDDYEMVCRRAAALCGRCGDPSLAPVMMEVYLNFPDELRVAFCIGQSMPCFPEEVLTSAVETLKPQMTYLDNEEIIEEALTTISNGVTKARQTIERIMAKDNSDRERINAIREVRNSNYHMYVPEFLSVVSDAENPINVRCAMAEALGWFNFSYLSGEILNGCRQMLSDSSLPPELRAELIQTINRLK